MNVATLMMLIAPAWWAQHHDRMEPVAAAIERAAPDVRTRALLATIDYHETSWHTARGRFAPFGVMRSLRQSMTEDEVIALALRFLEMGRRRCGSSLGMLGFYHFGRCRVTRWERREVETWRRFERMLRRPEPTPAPTREPEPTREPTPTREPAVSWLRDATRARRACASRGPSSGA